MTNPAEAAVDSAAPVGVWRIALRGEIDVATAPDAFADVTAAEASPGDVVTLDLSDVEFIDSHGVARLLQAQQYLDAMGCQLTLANPPDQAMRVLEMLGLAEQFAFDDG